MKKRSFVLGSCAAALAPQVLACAAPGENALRRTSVSAAASSALPALDDLSELDAWSHYLHEPFTLHGEQGSSWAVEIERVSPSAFAMPDLHQFSVGLRGEGVIPAGLYRLEHASGQGLTVYLAETGRGPLQTRLRADFSRLRA